MQTFGVINDKTERGQIKNSIDEKMDGLRENAFFLNDIARYKPDAGKNYHVPYFLDITRTERLTIVAAAFTQKI